MVAVGLTCVMILAACGGSDDAAPAEPDDAAQNEPAGDDAASPPVAASSAREVWVGELDGAPTVVEIGVSPDDAPELAAVEAYREVAGADPVEYVRVTVDNTGNDRANAAAYGDINGGDGLDAMLVLDFLCPELLFFWEVPFDTSLEADEANAQFEADIAARDEAGRGVGCDTYANEIPVGATASYWLILEASQPEIESLSIRFNDFERSS